jgi:hypothetical protein
MRLQSSAQKRESRAHKVEALVEMGRAESYRHVA